MTQVSSLTKAKLLNRLKHHQPKVETVTPDREARYELFAMTDMQQAYWLGRGNHLDGGDVAMHLYLEFQNESYDIERIKWALNEVIARHDMLHAVVLDSEHQQVLQDIPQVNIELLDFSGEPHRLEILRKELAHRKSDLTQWPQNQVVVTKLAENDYRLHLSLDLWCIDGRSYQILLKEFAFLYQHGSSDGLGSSTLTFRDYVVYQQSQRDTDTALKAKEYWKQRLETLPSAPSLPAKRNGKETGQGFERFLTTLPQDQTQQLKAYAQHHGVTLSSVLMTVYSLVLGKWSGDNGFTLNIPRFNRPSVHPDINQVIGEFATFSLLEVSLDTDLPFVEQVKKLQNQMMTDMEHSSVSGMELLRSLTQKHGSVANMPVVFTASPELGQEQKQFEDEIAIFGSIKHAISQTPQVDLDCQYFMLKDELNVNWDALVHKFEHGVISAMFDEFERLLSAISSNNANWNTSLKACLPDVQKTIWDEANDTVTPYDLVDWCAVLKDHAHRQPESIALVCGSDEITWSQLYTGVNTMAANLQAANPQSGLVALFLQKGPAQIMAAYACVIAGYAYLPIDVEAPSERVSSILSESGADVLVHQTESGFSELEIQKVHVDALTKDSGEQLSQKDSDADDLAYVIYTSGSTGTPKGVPIKHKGLSNFVQFNQRTFGLDQTDRIMALSAIHHDMSVFDLFSGLLAGATLIVPNEAHRRLPEEWLQLANEQKVTVWNGVPAAAQKLIVAANAQAITLESLKLMILGGDWVPTDTPELLKSVAPNCQLYTVGGPTEISVWNIFSKVSHYDGDWPSLPYGRPADNSGYLILSNDGELAPTWVAGEMLCTGTGVFDGYLHRPDLDEHAFISHPKYGRLYRTGDIGRIRPCGNLEFIGRTDNRVKLNGHRIELSEIEQIAASVSGVIQSVALIITGDHGDRLALCYLADSSLDDTLDVRLKQRMSESLPVALMPQNWLALNEWPLTANNKIDRQQLCDWCSKTGQDQQAIESALSVLLAQLWQQLIDENVQYMSDNFFMLGADSITATRLSSLVNDTFGIELSLADIFLSPTIQQQSILIGEKLVQATRQGDE